jgi:hypothetical protein
VTAPRRFLACAIVAALATGQLAALVLQEELFPFSPYNMYADIPPDGRYVLYRLEGPAGEIDDWRLLQPFASYGLSRSLRAIDESGRASDLPRVLHTLLVRMPAQITSLKLYRVTYEADASLDPRRGDRARSIAKRFVAEASR